jgi:hypothetical protein
LEKGCNLRRTTLHENTMPNSRTTLEDTNSLIEAFAHEHNLERLKHIAIGLSKPGATSKAAKSDHFIHRFDQLLDQATHQAGPNRLLALALVGRLRQQAKALAPRVQRHFEREVPSLDTPASELSDPLDRAYLARVLRSLSFENRDRYFAQFIVSEPPMQTDARTLATIGLLEAAPSLSKVFELLSEQLQSRKFDTQDPATSRTRQLVRAIEAISSALREIDPQIDYTVGKSYSKFVALALTEPAAVERVAAVEVARQILQLLIEFVRPNFSLVKYPETFEVVRTLRRLFQPADWPLETEKVREGVAKLIRESISLLAQSGVTDQRLRSLLIALVGEQRGQNSLTEMARDISGIGNDVRHWLETGKSVAKIESSESVSETILESVDRDIARAFRDTYLLSGVRGRVGDEMMDAAASRSELLKDAVKLLLTRVDATVRDCQVLAVARQLEFRFSVGDILEFSPEEHEADRPISGSRLVQIIAPQVIRVQRGRTPRIVLRARVTNEGQN